MRPWTEAIAADDFAAAKTADPTVANILGAAAVALATINVIGGFMVTDRMLKMFGKKK